MKGKRLAKIIFFFAAALLLLTGVMIIRFEQFPIEKEILGVVDSPSGKFKIQISRISAGATTKDVIKIERRYYDGTTELLKNIDNSDRLVSSELLTDELLRVVLADSSYLGKRVDTVDVQLPAVSIPKHLSY